jgi:hydroxyacylglutathione hydrolase
MQIHTVITTALETNTYIVSNGSKAVVIDPGGEYDKIMREITRLNVTVEAVLLTHGHFDHSNAAAFFQNDGAQVFCHAADLDKLTSYRGLAFFAGEKHNTLTADVALLGGEELKLIGLNIKVVHTPGHSKGSVCYIIGNDIFCGDTVFYGTYGRTDFYDGSFSEIKNSILNKLFNLKGDYKLYTGHGPSTTLDFERAHNEIRFDDD